MSILTSSFVIFVSVLLIIYYVLPQKLRWIVLLLGSIVFYFLSSRWLLLYTLFATVVIFVIGLMLNKYNEDIKNVNEISEKEKIKKKKKRLVFIAVFSTVLCIVFTKYLSFLLESVNGFTSFFQFTLFKSIPKVVVPLGISYYTLEAISYIVDIYRAKIEGEKNPFKVALFLLYFPKIIEGPISRFKELSICFYEENKFAFRNIFIGLDLIIYGLFKKMVIADRAGIFVNSIFSSDAHGITVFMAMLLYVVQIYAEFSGCIDIVRGVSSLFAVKLLNNFKRPFFSKSIQEFWQRWHISLGAWIKEYVFFPVSLSKMNAHVCQFCKKHFSNYWFKFVSIAFPLFFVWIFNGIWHGASFKYILYGMYYYVFMMLGVLFKPLSDKILAKMHLNQAVLNVWRIFRTVILVIVGMTLFRASSILEFGSMIGNLFSKGNGILGHGLVSLDFLLLLLSNVFILVVGILEEKKKFSVDEGFTKNPVVRGLVYSVLISMIVIFGIYGEGYDASNFIYGAF